jgi:hypothetical protein
MKLKGLDIIVLVYAVILIGAGVDGGMEHKTVALITRIVAGVVVLGLLALKQVNPRVSRIGTAVFALVILGHTGWEAIKKPGVTAMIITVASLIVVCSLVEGHFAAMKKHSGNAS